MNLDDYQVEAFKTAQYPYAGSGHILAVAYCGLGLGEAGEVQGKIKKILRDDGGEVTIERTEAILAELGDVLWYVANLANELGTDLSSVAEANLKKLQDRQSRGVITGSGDYR